MCSAKMPPAGSSQGKKFLCVQSSPIKAGFFWGLLSGSAAALRCQVDERVTGLSQLCDGHSSSLPDELSHGVQLLGSDGDKFPSVVNHSCRKRSNITME